MLKLWKMWSTSYEEQEASGNTEISPVILMKLISWGRNYCQEETQVKWMQEKIREKRL